MAIADEYELALDDARAQMAAQADTFALSERLRLLAGEAWAASWIDRTQDGQLVVLLTDVGALDGVDPREAGLPGFRVEPARFSLAQLQAENVALLEELKEAGVVSPRAYVDFRANRLAVEVPTAAGRDAYEELGIVLSPDEAAVIERTARKYPTATPVPTDLATTPFLGCHGSFGACDAPLRGGMEIHGFKDEGEELCTAGFNVRSTSDHLPYILTAGHCILDNGGSHFDNWGAWTKNLSGPFQVGQAHPFAIPRNPGMDDEALIEIDSPGWWGFPERTRVLVQSSGGTRPTTIDTGYTIDAVGLVSSLPADGYLCTTGAVTDTGCHSFYGTYGSWEAVLQVKFTDGEHVCRGDSGAPVFAGHKGYGMITAGQVTATVTHSIVTATQDFPCSYAGLSGPEPIVTYISLFRAMNQLNVELSPP